MDALREFLAPVLDAAQSALVAIVTAAGLAAIVWVKDWFSRRVQDEAAFGAALKAEIEAAEAEAGGAPKRSSAEKKKRAIEVAREALPMRHRPVMPGALGRTIERVLPAVRRASSPPPESP